jgi:undecaprenyl-diphosphatase
MHNRFKISSFFNNIMRINLRNWPILSVLAMIFAATSALLVFIKVAGEVIEGDTGKFDSLILMWLRVPGEPTHPLGPIWLEDFARDITALGSPAVLGLFVLIATGFLLLIAQRFFALFMLVSTVAGTFVVTIL